MSVKLIDARLGELELRRTPFTVIGFQIGSRAPRVVRRNRALADGMIDDTRFVGGRAVTVSLMLNEDLCARPTETMQDLFDRLLPFMAARRRPRLRWTVPGSPHERELVVRGEDAPVIIERDKHPAIVLSFDAADGEITTPFNPETDCTLIEPAIDVETGRTYDLVFNRTYPPSAAVGDRIVVQGGNERAHWSGVIFAGTGTTDPYVRINGVTLSFTDLVLPEGSTIVIDTRDRTMWLNGVPGDSVHQYSNFTQWAWEDLMLDAGTNSMRFGAAALGSGAVLQLCRRKTWAG